MSLACVLGVFSKNAREKDISFYFSNLGSSKDIFNEEANKYVTVKYLYDMSYHVHVSPMHICFQIEHVEEE